MTAKTQSRWSGAAGDFVFVRFERGERDAQVWTRPITVVMAYKLTWGII